MRVALRNEIQTLAYRLADVCALVATALQEATRALVEHDQALATEAIEQCGAVVELGAACEEQAAALMALHGPETAGVRALVVGIHIAADLTRMGEIAHQVADRVGGPPLPVETLPSFARLGRHAATAAHELQQIVSEPRGAHYAELDSASGLTEVAEQELLAWVGDRAWPHGARAGVDIALLAHRYAGFAGHVAAIARRVDHFMTELEPDPAMMQA